MRRPLPRWTALMAALALAGLLSACDRSKGPAPPKPSTAGSAPAQR